MLYASPALSWPKGLTKKEHWGLRFFLTMNDYDTDSLPGRPGVLESPETMLATMRKLSVLAHRDVINPAIGSWLKVRKDAAAEIMPLCPTRYEGLACSEDVAIGTFRSDVRVALIHRRLFGLTPVTVRALAALFDIISLRERGIDMNSTGPY